MNGRSMLRRIVPVVLAAAVVVGMAAVLALAVQLMVAETAVYIDRRVDASVFSDRGTPGIVVNVLSPTPTPKPPLLGSPECRVGMVCRVPPTPPPDCREETYAGGVCTNRGFLKID